MAVTVGLEFVRGSIRKAFRDMREPMAEAVTAAMDTTAEQVKRGGRAVMRSAGFSAKWASAWRVTRYPVKRTSLDPAIWAYSKIARIDAGGKRVEYAGVFEKGAKISGSPLLWLPLPSAPKIGRRKMTAALYIKTVGPLHRINREGKPPLLAGYVRGFGKSGRVTLGKLKTGERRHRAAGTRGLISVPLFVGISTVKIAKRFDFAPMWRKALDTLATEYARNLREG